MHLRKIFTPVHIRESQEALLGTLGDLDPLMLLDSHSYEDPYGNYRYIIGAGSVRTLRLQAGQGFKSLHQFYHQAPSWLLGYLSYSLQSEVEQVGSTPDLVPGFYDLYFFEPALLFLCTNQELEVWVSLDPAWDSWRQRLEHARSWRELLPDSPPQPSAKKGPAQFSEVGCAVPADVYDQKAQKLIRYMQEGDHYEINYCLPFTAQALTPPLEDAIIMALWKKLQDLAPAPFSGLFHAGEQWILSSSPERFLQKKGDRLLSQPMKGTAPRSVEKTQDLELKNSLLKSTKERSENTMITDLVRNDLSKVCLPGSVQVPEYCRVLTYPKAHQMISTVTGTLAPGIGLGPILRSTFPMGSMTGAPKPRALQRIAETEQMGRGVFSGAMGYISPQGDFDLNVLIRSLIAHSGSGTLAWPAGSALTVHCRPQDEYKECLLKAQLFRDLLGE